MHNTCNKSQSWHFTNYHSRMVEIIGIRNYAFHDPMPGHQINILWQNAVSVLYIFDHQWVNISLGSINSLRPRQNRRHFADAIFKRVFLNENILISIDISLKFVRKDPIDHIPALVQIMAWRRPGDKPLSEPMMISLPTHICATRPQWVKERFIPQSKVDHSEIWSFVKCGFGPSSCISQFANREIIYLQTEQIENRRH